MSCSVKPPVCSLRTIRFNMELGIVGLLLDTKIDDATDMAQLVHHLGCDALVACDVRTVDLDVDRGREAEVERLGDDVSGQEIEGDAAKLAREPLAEAADIVCGRVVFLFERDEDVGIGCAGEARAIVDVVDVADGQADVIENVVDLCGRYLFADLALHKIEQARGFFNAHSRRGPDMKNELPAVGLRKEIFAQERHQNEGSETKPQD